ncbi:MAG: pyridoxal phosphate-dependent aminotransferase [Burkholderiaceae bacterium]|nr:pyridoxal phosphate-dependent aminotransferase [Burkholderiaceae bacterium]
MNFFSDDQVNIEILRKRAFNYRWATHEPDVIPLTAADPDFSTAPPIIQAISNYCAAGYFPYGPPKGDLGFRNSIAQWFARKKNAQIFSDLILPVNSAAYGLFICAKAILKEGDNAIIPDPVDFLFRKSIEHAKGIVKTCSLDKKTAQFDVEELRKKIDSKTRAIFLCNPNNPLGKIIQKEHLETIIDIAKEYNLWIVSDEIWSDIFFEKPCISIRSSVLSHYERVLIVSGLSKNFALAGHRVGYVIAPDELTFNQIYQASEHATTAFGISVLAQVIGMTALTQCDDWLKAFQNHLSKMRKLTFEFIEEIPFFKNNFPDATYLAFPQLKNTELNSEEMVAKILKTAHVALIPGGVNWFESQSEGHIRICYSTSEAILTEAFERIKSCTNDLFKK